VLHQQSNTQAKQNKTTLATVADVGVGNWASLSIQRYLCIIYHKKASIR